MLHLAGAHRPLAGTEIERSEVVLRSSRRPAQRRQPATRILAAGG